MRLHQLLAQPASRDTLLRCTTTRGLSCGAARLLHIAASCHRALAYNSGSTHRQVHTSRLLKRVAQATVHRQEVCITRRERSTNRLPLTLSKPQAVLLARAYHKAAPCAAPSASNTPVNKSSEQVRPMFAAEAELKLEAGVGVVAPSQGGQVRHHWSVRLHIQVQ